jgi:hypothetical protein
MSSKRKRHQDNELDVDALEIMQDMLETLYNDIATKTTPHATAITKTLDEITRMLTRSIHKKELQHYLIDIKACIEEKKTHKLVQSEIELMLEAIHEVVNTGCKHIKPI